MDTIQSGIGLPKFLIFFLNQSPISIGIEVPAVKMPRVCEDKDGGKLYNFARGALRSDEAWLTARDLAAAEHSTRSTVYECSIKMKILTRLCRRAKYRTLTLLSDIRTKWK